MRGTERFGYLRALEVGINIGSNTKQTQPGDRKKGANGFSESRAFVKMLSFLLCLDDEIAVLLIQISDLWLTGNMNTESQS